MNTAIKIYSVRDSATAALRKLGIQSRDYSLFIEKTDAGFVCELGKATEHLASLFRATAPKTHDRQKKAVESVTKRKTVVVTATKEAGKSNTPKPAAKPAGGISETARNLILEGKTNQEVWAVLKSEFGLDDSKKHYPTWYRCEMKRRGILAA